MYIVCMGVEFDPKKAQANYQKHGVRFSDAELVLFDPFGITLPDESSNDEERFVTLGLDSLGRVLVVVFTMRERNVRLISARRATARERKKYEEGL